MIDFSPLGQRAVCCDYIFDGQVGVDGGDGVDGVGGGHGVVVGVVVG